MVARSTLRGVAGRALSFASSRRALITFVAPLTSCVPERSLSSYADDTSTTPAVASTQADRSGSDADDVMALGTPSSPTLAPDGVPAGASAAGTELAPPDETPVEGAPSNVDRPSSEAPPALRLQCRPECSCDLSDDREFMFCTTVVTYDEARARCQSSGGALPSIDDAARNEWLTGRMQTLAADDFWLSGTDLEDEGVWRWEDGRIFYDPTADAAAPAGFAPWQPTQPNDLNGEDCMRSIDGSWWDLDCTEQIAYVCQA
jgi:hypothetical protein